MIESLHIQRVVNLVQIVDDCVPPLTDDFNGAKAQIRIYEVPSGYRVDLLDYDQCFWWHPGIFPDIEVAIDWSIDALHRSLGSCDCDCLWDTGSFLELDGMDCWLYRGWFVCGWWEEIEFFDPLTNCCYIAETIKDVMERIDRIESDRTITPGQLTLF
ncbi:MAG: hypothetical protein WBB28_09390 [Crinalium sp.]